MQATAGHALKPGIRIRLWAWLSRLVTGLEVQYCFAVLRLTNRSSAPGRSSIRRRGRSFCRRLDPLPARLDVIPGCGEVAVPPPERLKPPPLAGQLASPPGQADISGLVHAVANAVMATATPCFIGRPAESLKPTESIGRGRRAAQEAAVQAGLSAAEAAATIASALRRGADV